MAKKRYQWLLVVLIFVSLALGACSGDENQKSISTPTANIQPPTVPKEAGACNTISAALAYGFAKGASTDLVSGNRATSGEINIYSCTNGYIVRIETDSDDLKTTYVDDFYVKGSPPSANLKGKVYTSSITLSYSKDKVDLQTLSVEKNKK